MHALVTGGCHGLGASFTLELLKRGYTVIALYLSSEKEAHAMEQKYENLRCIKCDLTSHQLKHACITAGRHVHNS